MNSVDDSTVATPADTSNLSSSESTSSNSQPTVKLRDEKNRKTRYLDRTFKADGHDPFVQTLDEAGRRLIESTGRTAQRSRASIRDPSRYNEECKSQFHPETSRCIENSWPICNYQPRKCRSTSNANCQENNVSRRVKKRHSYGAESSRRPRSQQEFKETPKRYSAGDYLRQQILEDLNSNEFIGKTDQQIAQDRCNRIMAYLRRRNDDSPHVPPETRLRELRNWSKFGTKREKASSSSAKANRRKDIERIRSYLQEKIRAKMIEEEWRNSEMKRWSSECPSELSIDEIRMRFSDYKRVQDRANCGTRRARSDNNVRLEATSSDSEDYRGKLNNSIFTDERGRSKRGNICRRTRSDVVPEKLIDFDDNEVKIRFYSFLGGRRNSWKTKSASTFEKKLSLPSQTSREIGGGNEVLTNYERKELTKNSDEEEDNFWRDQNCKKYCRRTRSDTVTRRSMENCGYQRKTKQRSISWSDKRKSRKKTNEISGGSEDSTSVESEMDSISRRREKKSLCSWREYKERRRHDQLRKELANVGDEENFNKVSSLPEAWKNFQQSFTDKLQLSVDKKSGEKLQETNSFQQSENDFLMSKRNELANIGDEENFFKVSSLPEAWKNFQQSCTEKLQETNSFQQSETDFLTSKHRADPTKTNENISVEFMRNSGDNSNDTETETILQENYLLLDRDEDQPLDFYRSPTISRLQVNEYRDQENSTIYGSDDPRFHYHPMIFDRREKNLDSIEFNANSNVKRSDTFKIVDGSEKTIDEECQKEIRIWNFNSSESSWLSNYSKCSEGTDSTNPTGQHSEADDSQTSAAAAAAVDAVAGRDAAAVALSNKDIATDYFRRVYELLKQRQEDARRETPEALTPTRHDSDTSNYDEQREMRKRRRRRKKDKNYQGEDLVTVSSGVRGDDDWRVQRILVNNDPENLIFRRPQLQNVTGHKRPRHPAPPIPANCKINAKDISKYFDYPNKENSPRNGVNENGRSQRNESIEQQQQQQQEHRELDSNEAEMGSNLSRHNGKGLTGRRTQSSGNLCDPKGKLNHVGKILVPCSSTQRDSRYKICGSLPNHLDDKEILDDDEPRENNNTISDTMGGIFGGTLPHKKRSLGVHFSDSSPTGTLDLVKHRSQDSLEGDPWRYQEGVDLDLVRCKHGKLDVVEKTESADVVDGEAVTSSSSERYGSIGRSSDRKCFRSAELDLVGTLPKRRTGDSAGGAFRQNFEARQNRWSDRTESHLPIKVTHKPDCELMKHHQFERVVDVKLSRLAGGEPQDQGYASERSPEDEHPPSLPGQPFPKVIPENAFIVTLQKTSRGLGFSLSGGGTAGPVRVKRLFPQQPAALSKKLETGDILLAANGVPLTGLTNYEALEVLRTTPSTVELVVCRVPGDTSVTSPGAPPPPPARREPPSSLRILNPQPSLQIEPCGEFDIEMTKVGGSLGFTLRKVDSSALGHYVRALVREPALSDGRIQPGDKIVSVDGAPLSPMSHEEAVALLRQCGPRVKLRLYRDLAQTPVSALSPTEPDHPLRPPRTSLRQEAVDMLCDLAVRKLSPDTSNGSNTRQTSGASCHSPRRLRKPLSRTPTADNHHEKHLTFHAVHPPTTSQTEASDTDQCSIKTQTTNSQSETPANDIIDPPSLYDVCDSSDSSKALPRPSFLDLSTRPEKPHFRFSLESESDNTGPIIVTESDSNLTAECDYDDDLGKDEVAVAAGLSSEEHDNNLPSEPASMPPLLSATPAAARTTSAAFSYKNPAYQSANPTCGGIDNSAKIKTAHSSDHDIPGKVLGAEDPAGSKGLLKWKGVMFAPNDEVQGTNEKTETEEAEKKSSVEFTPRNDVSENGNEVLTVELTRGWNSRLGFSLQPEDNSTVISVVHPDSVAAKDGRLMEGDVLIMVNDENVENIPTAEIIDLLRKIRGSIGITVIRKKKRKNES